MAPKEPEKNLLSSVVIEEVSDVLFLMLDKGNATVDCVCNTTVVAFAYAYIL